MLALDYWLGLEAFLDLVNIIQAIYMASITACVF